jgi:hypothetical protein
MESARRETKTGFLGLPIDFVIRPEFTLWAVVYVCTKVWPGIEYPPHISRDSAALKWAT